MATSTPSVVIRDLLAAGETPVGFINSVDLVNWSLHIGKQPDKPDRCITVYDSGGADPNPQWLVDYPTVQVRIRGNPNDYLEAHQKGGEIVDTLIGLPSQDIGQDRWVSVAQTGGIAFIGYDEKKRPMFSTNWRLIIEPSSGTHREPI